MSKRFRNKSRPIQGVKHAETLPHVIPTVIFFPVSETAESRLNRARNCERVIKKMLAMLEKNIAARGKFRLNRMYMSLVWGLPGSEQRGGMCPQGGLDGASRP